MGMQFEWVHHSDVPELVNPDELDELSPDGNENRDWALCSATGSNGIMIYGTVEGLAEWLRKANAQLAEPLRKARNKAIKERRRESGLPACMHEWQLQEDGYIRSWSTDVDEQGKTMTAVFSGTEDFSDEGDGEYLICETCGHIKPVGDYEIDYR